MQSVDLAIIGAGPAGLSAAIYGSRGGLKTMIFESNMIGGQIVLTNEVENYPGFEDTLSGFDLVEKMRLQALKFGAEIKDTTVLSINISDTIKEIITSEGNFQAKTIIVATGASPRKLEVPGEYRLIGRGVSYCATCDGALYRGKKVAVVGGGDSAVEEAVFLTKFAAKVYLIHRREELRAVYSIRQQAQKNEKLEFILNTVVQEINGEKQVQSLSLFNKKTNQSSELTLDGVFIYVGIVPNNELIKDLLDIDHQGFVITNENMETNIQGLYVAGDLRKKTLRQVVTATSDGAIAGFWAEKYIQENT